MRKNPFNDTCKPLVAADIAKVEKALGFALPASLKKHYLKQNGGIPKRTILQNDDYEFSVHYFMPMVHKNKTTPSTLEESYENIVRKRKLLPEGLIPFARSEGGDFYAMDRKTEEIFFYAMDTANPKDAKRFAANTLEEFLGEMLTTKEAYG